MMKDDIELRVRRLVVEHFCPRTDPATLEADVQFDRLGFDLESLVDVEFIMALEQEFDISIADEETPQIFRGILACSELVRVKGSPISF